MTGNLQALPRRALLLLVLLPLSFTACGGSGTDPKADLAPLVGVWHALSVEMTNQANPTTVIDLVETWQMEFTLSILATGQYSASILAFGQPQTEVGEISVSGSQITLTPTSPPGPAVSGTWRMTGGNLILEGETEFDFNQDGLMEPAYVFMEFEPVQE